MRWKGPDGRLHVPAPTAEITKMTTDLVISSRGSPWRIYSRMMVTVFPAFFLLYSCLLIVIGLVDWNPIIIIVASLISIPPILLALRITRPPIIQLWNATPDANGNTLHNRGSLPALTTPVPTRIERHLLTDGTPLEFPSSRGPWALFAICVIMGTALSFWISNSDGSLAPILAFGLLAIPLWILGFSIPVLAWWSVASNRLKISVRRVEAEAWLIAGMVSAFPAFMLNSLIVPELIPNHWSEIQASFAAIAIGAPIIEEICKATALLIFFSSMRGRRAGFLVGFSIGLGFALIENLQYIAVALFGGPAELAATTLVRGVGSIPAHALWTGFVGSAMGGMLDELKLDKLAEEKLTSTQIKIIDKVESVGLDFDGDGVAEGFKTDRNLLKNLDSQGDWIIIGSQSMIPRNIAVRPSARRSVQLSLVLAIVGHSLWNGLSIGATALTQSMGFNSSASLIITLALIVGMVATVILLTLRELQFHSLSS